MSENKKIEITDLALAEIDAMRNRVHELRLSYGEDSPEYKNAMNSFGHVMHKIMILGGTIFKDGELSLVCSNDYITYGVVWFGDRNADSLTPESGEWSVHS